MEQALFTLIYHLEILNMLRLQAHLYLRIDFSYTTSNVPAGQVCTIAGLRIFEVPVGSEIESDATNLTADQLAAKYPYIKGGSANSTISAGRLRRYWEEFVCLILTESKLYWV